MTLDLKNNPKAREGRRWANIRALKLAAGRDGITIAAYLKEHGLTREEFLEGKRPAGYAERTKCASLKSGIRCTRTNRHRDYHENGKRRWL